MLPPTFSRLVPVQCKSGEVSQNRSVMVRYFKNQKEGSTNAGCVTVIFVPGFLSNGLGPKAELLAEVCSAKGYNFVSYCPEGNTDLRMLLRIFESALLLFFLLRNPSMLIDT